MPASFRRYHGPALPLIMEVGAGPTSALFNESEGREWGLGVAAAIDYLPLYDGWVAHSIDDSV